MKKQTVKETLAIIGRQRPPFKSFFETFEPLLTQRRLTAERLAPLLASAGFSLEAKSARVPLLKEKQSEGLAPFMREAARDMLPLVSALETVAPYKEKLEGLFSANGEERDVEALFYAMLAETPDALMELAKKYRLEPRILSFAGEFIVSTVLRALAAELEDEEFGDWRKGVCPVCGTAPTIAWLAKRPPVEKNEFLAGGGGRKHLHCGMCGANWYFVRGICPSCGAQGQDAMNILGEEDRRHERIDWCKKCNVYLPLIDLRELANVPDLDAMALGLMHLDLAAAEKALMPLKHSFWNTI